MPSMTTQSDILTRFGRRVRALRTARGQSQETFAETCGIDRTYISGIERGRRSMFGICVYAVSDINTYPEHTSVEDQRTLHDNLGTKLRCYRAERFTLSGSYS
jgi:DNA-binding XRE family transcriptional regulator